MCVMLHVLTASYGASVLLFFHQYYNHFSIACPISRSKYQQLVMDDWWNYIIYQKHHINNKCLE